MDKLVGDILFVINVTMLRKYHFEIHITRAFSLHTSPNLILNIMSLNPDFLG